MLQLQGTDLCGVQCQLCDRCERRLRRTLVPGSGKQTAPFRMCVLQLMVNLFGAALLVTHPKNVTVKVLFVPHHACPCRDWNPDLPCLLPGLQQRFGVADSRAICITLRPNAVLPELAPGDASLALLRVLNNTVNPTTVCAKRATLLIGGVPCCIGTALVCRSPTQGDGTYVVSLPYAWWFTDSISCESWANVRHCKKGVLRLLAHDNTPHIVPVVITHVDFTPFTPYRSVTCSERHVAAPPAPQQQQQQQQQQPQPHPPFAYMGGVGLSLPDSGPSHVKQEQVTPGVGRASAFGAAEYYESHKTTEEAESMRQRKKPRITPSGLTLGASVSGETHGLPPVDAHPGRSVTSASNPGPDVMIVQPSTSSASVLTPQPGIVFHEVQSDGSRPLPSRASAVSNLSSNAFGRNPDPFNVPDAGFYEAPPPAAAVVRQAQHGSRPNPSRASALSHPSSNASGRDPDPFNVSAAGFYEVPPPAAAVVRQARHSSRPNPSRASALSYPSSNASGGFPSDFDLLSASQAMSHAIAPRQGLSAAETPGEPCTPDHARPDAESALLT